MIDRRSLASGNARRSDALVTAPLRRIYRQVLTVGGEPKMHTRAVRIAGSLWSVDVDGIVSI
jgi:hypothetical protein